MEEKTYARNELLYGKYLDQARKILARVRRSGIFRLGAGMGELLSERVEIEQVDGSWLTVENPTRDEWATNPALRPIRTCDDQYPAVW